MYYYLQLSHTLFFRITKWYTYICYLPAGGFVKQKSYDQGLENSARGLQPLPTFSSPRSRFFSMWTDPELVNNLIFFFAFPQITFNYLRQIIVHVFPTHLCICYHDHNCGHREENQNCFKKWSNCRIYYHAFLDIINCLFTPVHN